VPETPPAPGSGGAGAAGVGEGVGGGVGEEVGEDVGEGVGDGVGDGVGEGDGEFVGEAVGEAVGVGAKATKLTVPELLADPLPELLAAGIPVTQLVRFEAFMRSHLCEAVMDPADGYASYMMAASPATCGHAMDVPEPWANESSARL